MEGTVSQTPLVRSPTVKGSEGSGNLLLSRSGTPEFLFSEPLGFFTIVGGAGFFCEDDDT